MRRNPLCVGCILSLGILVALLAASRSSESQSAGTEPSDRPDAVDLQRNAESALDRIQRNDVGQGIVDATYYIEQAAHVEAARAIPVLETYFAQSHELDLRSEIASVLVSLGDRDPQFWKLISNQAKAALTEDPPDPFEMGPAGESSVPCSSVNFLNWAKSRNLSLEVACQEASIGIPQRVHPLADSGDRRGIPILQQALHSHDPLIVLLAAHGLVVTGDSDATTLVIEAIEHAPKDQARNLAQSLIESDDPRAPSVLHQYWPDVNYREAHQFRTQGANWRRPFLTRK